MLLFASRFLSPLFLSSVVDLLLVSGVSLSRHSGPGTRRSAALAFLPRHQQALLFSSLMLTLLLLVQLVLVVTGRSVAKPVSAQGVAKRESRSHSGSRGGEVASVFEQQSEEDQDEQDLLSLDSEQEKKEAHAVKAVAELLRPTADSRAKEAPVAPATTTTVDGASVGGVGVMVAVPSDLGPSSSGSGFEPAIIGGAPPQFSAAYAGGRRRSQPSYARERLSSRSSSGTSSGSPPLPEEFTTAHPLSSGGVKETASSMMWGVRPSSRYRRRKGAGASARLNSARPRRRAAEAKHVLLLQQEANTTTSSSMPSSSGSNSSFFEDPAVVPAPAERGGLAQEAPSSKPAQPGGGVVGKRDQQQKESQEEDHPEEDSRRSKPSSWSASLAALKMELSARTESLLSSRTTSFLIGTIRRSLSFSAAKESGSGALLLCAFLVLAVLLVGGVTAAMGAVNHESHYDEYQADRARAGFDEATYHPARGGSMGGGATPGGRNSGGAATPMYQQQESGRGSVGPRGSSGASTPGGSQSGRASTGRTGGSMTPVTTALCPSLVVPNGSEFVFAIKEVVKLQRQEQFFNVVDLKGLPLSRVVISEQGGHPGILLQTLLKQNLAFVSTEHAFVSTGGPGGDSVSLDICRPNGEVFGSLQREGSSGRYVLKQKGGNRKILTFHGDFQEHAVNVLNAQGQLISCTERCTVDFDTANYYQVRVAPNVDAGLVICGLLSIDKLERRP